MNICVFCASSEQIDPTYVRAASLLGKQIAARGWNLVYGGTTCGLMRVVAEATLKGGGRVTGIIPRCIVDRGVAARDISELTVVDDMKERKSLLRERADAFIALPGGWGTLEEITEVVTLKQLGEHHKPIVFLNTNDFYEYFFLFIHTIQKEGFISSGYDRIFEVLSSVEEAMDYIENYKIENLQFKY
ncbi:MULTISPECIES: TIGR00730 family Rossman fold protein [Porphyromonadaceae]|uniref:Cytokinin riboside 5'-monophosphate phosphoribohydrolase n=1 Tax=Sanguibacteroides justesenii TaxID=1547597 RepID=A0A0C3R6K7_9PORP|nr:MULTISPECIES: TIGR00730 family Rossman fold protein [Porphyromonadaceae]KIO43468.1 hypothetical protein IE90_10045 [Sanguibacteroides justesenii]KIO45645.1 hypothetical protein BA92_04060 [Sanguibacteroides justesenii]PXZ45261.1 TIGR00730 family Rossman fold protein [Sanguibacteroides justesenii]